LEQTSVCVVDQTGNIVREAKVESDPAALAAWFAGIETPMTQIGLEAGPLSQWLPVARKLLVGKVIDFEKGVPSRTPCDLAMSVDQVRHSSPGRPIKRLGVDQRCSANPGRSGSC
jgi:hypothetical protein